MKKTTFFLLVVVATLFVASGAALAFTPANGDFFWEPYDWASTVTKGSGGAMVGLAGIVGASLSLMKGSIPGAAFCAVGAVGLVAGPKAVTAMGFLF
ncbi:hypothetical protein [Geomonas subterranea]|uniref:hypothetical protein n=1 Tax=Geomonas subterranea TaxID=2847989 RepID=UPI001CD44771|nr:hypothetical protein [Geomonas fuzhouensis]